MDMSNADAEEAQQGPTLSYDDTVAYEDQKPAVPALASRIGNTKVYLLSESSSSRKRKHGDDEGDERGEPDPDVEMDEDLSHRENALLLTGTPISHLPTARLFAYATHFDAKPLGLEWVDDSTCVFVFDSKAAARNAFQALQKSSEPPTLDEADIQYVSAKPLPIHLWPPEERISKSLGKAEGTSESLKGPIRMRWARTEDVKKRGAKQESEFYRKHGEMAGKELFNGREGPGASKRRRTNHRDDRELAKRLDQDLDEFLAEDDVPEEPPSKMRSDYIASDGRTVLDSERRSPSLDLGSRLSSPKPSRRRRGGRRRNGRPKSSERSEHRGGGGGRRERPHKTQQELDDELDAFLREPQDQEA